MIRITVTNPAEHKPQELRTLALYLQSAAEDIEAGRVSAEPALPNPLAFADAPGASDPEPETAGASAELPTFDANGLPWDERIHASSKALNADGTWRYKRGGDLAERATVEAELRGAAEPVDDIPPPPVEEPADDIPPPPPAEPEEAAAPVVTVGDVFKRITGLQKEGKLPQAELNMALEIVGMASTGDIMKAADRAAEVLAAINTVVGA